MVDVLQSSVRVSFGNDSRRDGGDGDIRWEVDDTRTPAADNEMFIRLYPSQADKVIATSGSLSKKGNDTSTHDNVVVFSGNSEVKVGHPKAYGVTLNPMGSAYDPDGNSISVTFSYNQAKGVVVANKPCYAVVSVSYTAPYCLYLFTFAGTGCALKYVLGEYVFIGGYIPSYLVALSTTEKATDTIQLDPEPCGGSISVSYDKDNAGPVNIVLEIHKDFTPRVIGSTTTDGVKVGCKVRLIPAVSADIDVSSGSYKKEEFVGSGSKADKDSRILDTNNYDPQYTEVIKDLISFNVSHSTKLRYQPSGSMTITPTGPFLDSWGNSVSPTFATPGDTIVEVEWVNEHTYKNPKSRVVQEDEIVALTSGNKTIDVYGAAAVDYTINFSVFDVSFQQTDALKAENGWENIHMLARYNGQTAYLSLPAPSVKEK